MADPVQSVLPQNPSPEPGTGPGRVNSPGITSGGSFGSSNAGEIPGWVIFGGGLAVTGVVVTILSKVGGESAGYLFALIVILGYAAAGGRAANVINFMQSVGLLTGQSVQEH